MNEYLIQLKLLKPVIERQFQGLKIFIGCRDDRIHLLDGPDSLKVTELKSRRYDFGHIKELRFDGKVHPVEEFLLESDVKDWAVEVPEKVEHSAKCVIITHGDYPTRNLEAREVEALKKWAREERYDVEIDGSVENAGLVIGVESQKFFEAASKGVSTKLISKGLGTRLYKKMFPKGIVMDI